MALLPPALIKHKGVFVGAVLSVLLGLAVFAGHRGASDLLELEEEQQALAQKMVRLQRGNDELRRHLERMQTDPQYLERVVRQRLGWGRPGEIVYRVE
jgi:cell division protein FtsB